MDQTLKKQMTQTMMLAGVFLTASKKFKEDDLNVDCSHLSYMVTGREGGYLLLLFLIQGRTVG